MASRLGISEQVRRELKKAQRGGRSLYSVAKDTKLSYQTVHRFYSGSHTLTTENLEKVIDALEFKLDLVPKRGRH